MFGFLQVVSSERDARRFVGRYGLFNRPGQCLTCVYLSSLTPQEEAKVVRTMLTVITTAPSRVEFAGYGHVNVADVDLNFRSRRCITIETARHSFLLRNRSRRLITKAIHALRHQRTERPAAELLSQLQAAA